MIISIQFVSLDLLNSIELKRIEFESIELKI